MKTLTLITCFLFLSPLIAMAQLITLSEYSKMIKNTDEFPNNIVERLETEGLKLMYDSNKGAVIKLTYTLQKENPYFFNVSIQRDGPVRVINLAFNTNTAEFKRLSTEIITKMVKQPKSKHGDPSEVYYKDSNNIYYGLDISEDNSLYQISICNFEAYKRYYLVNGNE